MNLLNSKHAPVGMGLLGGDDTGRAKQLAQLLLISPTPQTAHKIITELTKHKTPESTQIIKVLQHIAENPDMLRQMAVQVMRAL